MLQLKLARDEQAQATGRRTNLRNLRYPIDTTLVLGVVLGAGEWVRHARGATVDGGVGGSAYIKLSEGVKVNIDLVLRVAFALSFDLLRLCLIVSIGISNRRE